MSDDVFPDRDMDHADKISWVIETKGWCAEPVAPCDDPPSPGYTYSIGLESSYQHPEIVIFGLQPVAAHGLLEMIVMHISNGGVIPDGMFVGLLDNDLPAALLPIDMEAEELAELFPAAARFHGDHPYRVCQFVWPDRSGKLPWDDDYDGRLRYAQPVLGT